MADMNAHAERRRSRRYSIERSLQYRLHGVRPALSGAGVTVNMSSDGVLFRAQEALLVGNPILLEISWPVLLNESRPLKLVVRGRVVWSGAELSAMRIEGWDFRTRGAGPA